MDWLLRQFSILLDMIVYNLIPLFYNTLLSISKVSILSMDTIENFASRIYLMLGIFMLFKLTFSLIQMFANPDSAKGDKGVGKLVQKVVVMLVLLVSVPIIFEYAYKIQGIILNENILGNIVLGGSSIGDEKMKEEFKTAGDKIAIQVYKGFFHPTNVNPPLPDEWVNMKSVNEVWDKNLQQEKDGNTYKYSYMTLISTAAGGLTAWVIGLFCFDVAIRSVKLAFLQLIAPVPIIASIDPKGKKTFDSWLQECIKTFLDVFIRLIAIYFVVFIVIEITSGPGFIFTFYEPGSNTPTTDVNLFVGAMVIIGLLIFAKRLPKLLEDILGIKLGGFKFNPLKRLEEAAGLGGIARAGNSSMGAGASIAKNVPRLLGGMGLDKLRGKDVETGYQTRKDAMLAEARARMHNRSEKYSGETYSGILNKEKEELSRNRTKGQKEIAERSKMMTDGKIYFEGGTDAKVKAFAQALANGLNESEAKAYASSTANRAVFKNEGFVKTLEKMDSEKGEMYALKNAAQMAESKYSAALTTNNKDQIEAAKIALEKANKDSGTAEKRYEFAKQEHESNRKIYASDAKIQDAKDVYEKTEKQEVLKKYEEEATKKYTVSTTTETTVQPEHNSVKIKPSDVSYRGNGNHGIIPPVPPKK